MSRFVCFSSKYIITNNKTNTTYAIFCIDLQIIISINIARWIIVYGFDDCYIIEHCDGSVPSCGNPAPGIPGKQGIPGIPGSPGIPEPLSIVSSPTISAGGWPYSCSYKELVTFFFVVIKQLFATNHKNFTFCIRANTFLNLSFFTSAESSAFSCSSSAQITLNSSCCFVNRSRSAASTLPSFSANHSGYLTSSSRRLGNRTSADNRLCIIPWTNGMMGLAARAACFFYMQKMVVISMKLKLSY